MLLPTSGIDHSQSLQTIHTNLVRSKPNYGSISQVSVMDECIGTLGVSSPKDQYRRVRGGPMCRGHLIEC